MAGCMAVIGMARPSKRLVSYWRSFPAGSSCGGAPFDELADWVPAGSCDGVLLDLGMSSPQLDWAERGFSFQQEGPLDARMDQRQELTAAHLVNEASADELAKIFWELGEERESRRIARAIVNETKARSF